MATKSQKTNTEQLSELFLESNRIYGPSLSKKEMDQLIIKQSKLLADTAKSEKEFQEMISKPPTPQM